MEGLDERNINGGNMMEGRMRRMMCEVLDSRGVGEGGRAGGLAEPAPAAPMAAEGDASTFLHIYGEKMHKIPDGWMLPTLRAFQMWQL